MTPHSQAPLLRAEAEALFKRGKYDPFVPAPGDKARDTAEELRIQAHLARDLAVGRGRGALVLALGHHALASANAQAGVT